MRDYNVYNVGGDFKKALSFLGWGSGEEVLTLVASVCATTVVYHDALAHGDRKQAISAVYKSAENGRETA